MASLVYQSLKQLGYPIFKPKLQQVTGVHHLPASGGYVIAANHVDWLDGFYIAAAIGSARDIPVYFVSKSNNYRWTTITIQIPEKPSAVVDTAVKYLRAGRVICNFPEGQRNFTHTLLPGKTGTVRMAIEAGVPIIPVGITCTPGRNMAQSVLYLLSNKHPVSLRIGRPLVFSATDNTGPKFLRESTDQVMRAIAPLAGKKY